MASAVIQVRLFDLLLRGNGRAGGVVGCSGGAGGRWVAEWGYRRGRLSLGGFSGVWRWSGWGWLALFRLVCGILVLFLPGRLRSWFLGGLRRFLGFFLLSWFFLGFVVIRLLPGKGRRAGKKKQKSGADGKFHATSVCLRLTATDSVSMVNMDGGTGNF